MFKMKDKKIIMLEAEDLDVLADMIADRLATRLGDTTHNVCAGEDELVTTKEACQILHVSPRTMQNYRDRKIFRVVKTAGPKKALYYKQDILEYLEAHTKKNRDTSK